MGLKFSAKEKIQSSELCRSTKELDKTLLNMVFISNVNSENCFGQTFD